MSTFLRITFLMFFGFTVATFSSATDIFVAQNAVGGNTGADCNDAHSVAWLNSASNWGTGANQVGPGSTVHLCGTFTGTANSTMITTQGNGVSGNPIVIRFESGALMRAPYWSASGAINIPNNFITLDGGSNGTIENTLNGTPSGACLGGACTQQQPSLGVDATGHDITIQNLIVTHIYVHTEDVVDVLGGANTGIETDGANSLVTNNTVDNVYTGIVNGGTNISNIEFSFNKLTFCNHCIKSAISSGNVTGLKIHDNDISSMYNWDEVDNFYHHNGIFVFALAGCHTGAQYYNNYIHGMMSRDAAYGASHVTGWMFMEYCNTGAEFFNNILEADAGAENYPDNGYITEGGVNDSGTSYYWNNTIIAAQNSGSCINTGTPSTVTVNVSNNIFYNCGYAINVNNSGVKMNIDNNLYFSTGGAAGPWVINNAQYSSFSAWKSACNCDSHSQNGNDPKLDASFHLQSTSSAIKQGLNLTSMSVTPLDSDKSGMPRPTGSSWDLGAYNSGTSSASVNPPQGLTATVD